MKKNLCIILFVFIFIFNTNVFADERACNYYASKGENACNSASYQGYKCKWDGTKKGGSRCFKSGNLAESVKETITSCEQIKSSETCRSSKIDGHECIWRQNACYSNNIVDDGTEDTVIADDQDDREKIEEEKNDAQVDKNNNYGGSYDNVTNSDRTDCSSLGLLKGDIQGIFKIFKIVAPILTIVLSIYDFIKAIAGKVDGEVKKVFMKLLKRLAFAVILFFLPDLLDFFLGLVDPGYSTCINS